MNGRCSWGPGVGRPQDRAASTLAGIRIIQGTCYGCMFLAPLLEIVTLWVWGGAQNLPVT